MPKQTALIIIAIVSIAGILFSGYLSYRELFGAGCKVGCSSIKIASLPPCVYGLVMYTLVLIVSLLGLSSGV